ncbi:MAG: TlpA family protein disulfide reductase [Actinomycetes bacterium]
MPRRRLPTVLAGLALLGLVAWGVVSALGAGDQAEQPAAPTTASRVPPPNTEPDLRPVEPGVASVGSLAPTIDLPALRRPGRVRVADAPGAPVLLNFWASWCIPCREEFPALRRIERTFGRRGLRVVGVTFDDRRADAIRFATAERATWELAYDAEGEAARDYGVRAAPQTILIDRRGVIIERWYGRPSSDRFDAAARRLLAAP